MAKKTPAWQIMGLDAPPPTVAGFHAYGTVWTPADGSQREPLSAAVRLAVWSWAYWFRKVRRDILSERSAGVRGSLVLRISDRIALALAALADRVHRSIG